MIWRVLTQLVWALSDCLSHPKGKVLHRDLKPANVFIDPKRNDIKIGVCACVCVRAPLVLLLVVLLLVLCHSPNCKTAAGDFGLARVMGDKTQFATTNVGTPYYM